MKLAANLTSLGKLEALPRNPGHRASLG